MKHFKQLVIPLLSFWLLSYNPVCAQLETTRFHITDGLEDSKLKNTIENNISTFLSACNQAVMDGNSPKISSNVLTKDAQKTLQSLWKTSEMSCFLSKTEEKCLVKPNGGYQVRNIPVTMLAAPDREQEQEIVINFTRDGRIDDIYLAVEENKYLEILSDTVSVQDFVNRQMILDFVENFRTAYNRKDIPYLTSIFSNNALIITGKVIKEKNKSDHALSSLGKEKIVYQTQSKTEYLTRLKRVFASNKYLNIVFDELEILQHPKYDNFYGVTLKQDWNTSNYQDVGYVFLMIDFRDESNPLIHVRTWQPERYNNKPLARDEIFNFGSFGDIGGI